MAYSGSAAFSVALRNWTGRGDRTWRHISSGRRDPAIPRTWRAAIRGS